MTDERSGLAERAERLRAAHHEDLPLVLPNVWDAGGARLAEQAGFPAIATTSGGVAVSLGHADGQRTPVAEMFAAVGRIARAVTVPVTADLEAGYGLPPAEFVERLLAAGAVGCNLEDTDHAGGALVAAEAQADRLAAVRAAADAAGVPIVINARVDVFVRQVGPPEERLAEGLRRARQYLAAGADCVYPILLEDASQLAAFVRDLGAPVNVMLRAGGPSLDGLARLGVARISVGSGLHHAGSAALRESLERLRSGRDPYTAS
jgi:2-methylisocitrate lyase-like PEP mutase family enzyme